MFYAAFVYLPASKIAGRAGMSLIHTVFDSHRLVLLSVVVREFVQEVTLIALDSQVALGHLLAVLFPVVRTVLFPREFPLFAFQLLSFSL